MQSGTPRQVGPPSSRFYHEQIQGRRYCRQQPYTGARRRGRRADAVDGYQDLDAKRPVDRDTIYHWASITKTFTGIAIMQLRDRGLLSLDDPIVKYVPEFRQGAQPVRRCLAGHDPPHDDPQLGAARDRPGRGAAISRGIRSSRPSGSSSSRCFRTRELIFDPGTQYSYSNPGVIFLGRIIELLSGDDYEVYITKNILMPLGMHASFFDRAPYYLRAAPFAQLHAHGRRPDGDAVSISIPASRCRTAA